MGRLILILAAAFLATAIALPLSAEENDTGRMYLSADDLASPERGVSIFRYGGFGSGAFPYRDAAPGIPVAVRVNGAPLEAFSPFGPDLESIPRIYWNESAALVHDEFSLTFPDSMPDKPVTKIDFLSGVRRRSMFEGLFRRKIGERSELRAVGLSDGISGGETIAGNSLRDYELSWIRLSKNGVRTEVSASGSRDRSDVFDLGSVSRMGGRTIDATRISAAADGIVLAGKTAFSVSWGIRNGRSRFERNSKTVDFDDDSYGFEARLKPLSGGAKWEAAVRRDSRLLDGRGENLSRRYGVTSVLYETRRRLGPAGMDFKAEALHSGRFGAGYDGDAGLSIPAGENMRLELRGNASTGFPGPEHELYSVLSFSDSTRFLSLRRWRSMNMEAGFRASRGLLEFGAYGFGGRYDVPVFVPGPTGMRMSGQTGAAGFRGFVSARRDGITNLNGSLSFRWTGVNAPDVLWPRPNLEIDFRETASRVFLTGALHGALDANMRIVHWRTGAADPSGAAFFVDVTARARISTCVLYYMMENIADDRSSLLGPLRVEGRNASWGVRWSLID